MRPRVLRATDAPRGSGANGPGAGAHAPVATASRPSRPVWTAAVPRWDATARRAPRAAFAMLLLADFGGPMRSRLGAHASLALAGSAPVALGTVCSKVTWLSLVVAGVGGAAVLFAGILSGYAAKGPTAALLVLVLLLTIPADPAAIGPRLEGWALAVTVAKVTNVRHGFWVVLGTLAVLRSSARGTGATVLRARRDHARVRRRRRPPRRARRPRGRALGRAPGRRCPRRARTGADLVPRGAGGVHRPPRGALRHRPADNIVRRTGWRVGLVRVEDVSIGCAISLGLRVLPWPRGVAPVVSVVLADAHRTSSDYLSSAVHELLGRHVPRRTEDAAAASARRVASTRRSAAA